MLSPAVINISADRWVMCRRNFAFVGYDFTSAAFKMQIATIKDVATALLTLTTQTTDVQGIRVSYAGTDTITNLLTNGWLAQSDVDALLATKNPATGVDYVMSDSILLSVVALRIDDATMNGLAMDTDGGDVTCYYDMQITPSGGDQDVYMKGTFTILAGVTQ